MFNKVDKLAKEFKIFLSAKRVTAKESIPLIIDKDLLFVSAAISAIKDNMLDSTNIDTCFVLQPCFRYHTQYQALFGFSMLGMFCSTQQGTPKIVSMLFELLNHIGLERKDLYIVSKANSHYLNSLVVDEVVASNIFYQDLNNQFYSVDWLFGNEVLIGEGLTLVYKSEQKCNCKHGQCSPLDGCEKYYPLGNIIIVTNTLSAHQYIDIGIGLESVLCALNKIEYWDICPAKSIIEYLQNIKFTEEQSREFARNILGISTLVDAGVEISNKRQGYILKRMIREVFHLLLERKMKNTTAVNLNAVDKLLGEISGLEYLQNRPSLFLLIKLHITEYANNLTKSCKKVFNEITGELKQGISIESLHATYGINKQINEGIQNRTLTI